MVNPRYRRLFRLLVAGLLVLFPLLQFIPGPDRTNPPVTGEPPWDTPETRAMFVTACADCHSNQTVYPWYSTIAPVSWLVAHDVKEGREHFNISTWDRSTRGGEDAAEEVQRGSMPDGLYLLMHGDANFTAAEKKKFVEGLRRTFSLTAPDPAAGGRADHEKPEGVD